MEKRIGNIIIEFLEGDITSIKADAIVNAANNHLWMGSGVAGAIKRKGGAEIEKEAVKKGPIPVGEAVVTTAGALPAKYVIHAAGMGQDLKTDKEKVYNATLNSLKRAKELNLKSIAFPSIGTGVGGLAFEECANSMISALLSHLKEGTTLEKITFVLFGQEALQRFENKASELLANIEI